MNHYETLRGKLDFLDDELTELVRNLAVIDMRSKVTELIAPFRGKRDEQAQDTLCTHVVLGLMRLNKAEGREQQRLCVNGLQALIDVGMRFCEQELAQEVTALTGPTDSGFGPQTPPTRSPTRATTATAMACFVRRATSARAIASASSGTSTLIGGSRKSLPLIA